MVEINFDTSCINDYERFLKVQALPRCTWRGTCACVPDEYAASLGIITKAATDTQYTPSKWLFDYQAAITAIAIAKRKYAVFADCGLGKTIIMLEYIRHALQHIPSDQSILIINPLMVTRQTIAEAQRWYGDSLPIERVAAKNLASWCESPTSRIGITNFDALNESIPQGKIGGLVIDESSMLKSHYGAWGQEIIRLGRGLDWKLCLTGTPAPNDRIEFANHAVFLDRYPTINSFLARFFVNRGQTDNRWELKPHAIEPFYRSLADWCMFIARPSVYGWKDCNDNLPPINVHIEDVPLTQEQRSLLQDKTGALFADQAGGITSRARLAGLAKGWDGDRKVSTNKYDYIKAIVDKHSDESIIIWCKYNNEQDTVAALIPDAANIDGSTPDDKRAQLIDDFCSKRTRVLISKPRILGFGLNLQVCTRQIFSGLQDSYEEYYQAVKRSNRYGSTKPLNVHIPVTEIERPMIYTVLEKAHRVQSDTEQQERMFVTSMRSQ